VANVLRIEINNAQETLAIDESRLSESVRAVLAGEGIESGNVSVAIIDAGTMHELNRRHLEHDYPTDVLSFLLERDGNALEGEVIASADEAILNAPRYGWPPESELTLYVIHGALHLCGYDDLEESLAQAMHARQDYWMESLGHAVFAEKQP
jgi:probable rRNA maturation factor